MVTCSAENFTSRDSALLELRMQPEDNGYLYVKQYNLTPKYYNGVRAVSVGCSGLDMTLRERLFFLINVRAVEV